MNILNFLTQKPLYGNRLMSWTQHKRLLKKQPWWSRVKWLRWFRYFLPWHRGFVVNGRDHLSLNKSYSNMLVVGRTGSGKSVNSVIPNLLRLQGHSAVVVDPGELFEKTSGYLASQGYDIRVLNLGNPEQSDCINPLDYVEDKTDIDKVISMIVRNSLGLGGDNAAFWNISAGSSMKPLLKMVVNQPDEACRNLANLRHLLMSFGEDGERLSELAVDYLDLRSFDEYVSFLKSSPSLRKNILTTAAAATAIFADPAVAKLTARSTFHFRQLREKPTILYIKTPPEELAHYKHLIMLIYHFLFKEAMKTPSRGDLSIMFLLEEFANSGIAELPEFVNIITTCRKKRAFMMLVVQDIQQMNMLLGQAKTTSIISGGIDSVLYLPKQSLETAQHLERLIGDTHRTYTDHKGELQESIRPVLSAQEITQLPLNTALFHHGNYPVGVLQMFPYLYSFWLRRRSHIKPVEVVNEDYDNELEYISLPLIDQRKPEPVPAEVMEEDL
jgi:type IV secretion system protein VirD4